MPKIKYICPYCFEEHPIYDVEFQCKNKRCDLVGDNEYTKYSNSKVPLLRHRCFPGTTKPIGGMPERGECPECKEASSTRVCPSCHNKLPSAIDSNNDMIISIIGSRDSGKSSYVGVMIRELRKRIAIKFGGAASFMDKEDSKLYDEKFGKYIYPLDGNGKPKRLPQTKTNLRGRDMSGVNRPILCDLKFEKKKFMRNQIIPYTIVFFDTAGEDFDDEDVMFTVTKYIAKSKGIIFLMDPLQIPKVRKQLPEEIVKRASTIDLGSTSEAKDIILRTANLIRHSKKIKSHQKVDIPVAVAFSKLDAITSLLPGGSALKRESTHCSLGKFDEQDMIAINEEMLGLLNEWDEQEFVANLKTNYKNAKLFGFSSFGNCPDDRGNLEPPKPHRIEDSFLWILNQLKAIS